MNIEKAKSWVRIWVTSAFAAAFIAGFIWLDKIPPEAFIGVAVFVITWWFKDQSEKKKDEQIAELTNRIAAINGK